MPLEMSQGALWAPSNSEGCYEAELHVRAEACAITQWGVHPVGGNIKLQSDIVFTQAQSV